MYKKRSSENQVQGDFKSKGQKAIEKFTEMMISRMESMKAGDWKKGWIDGAVYGMPQNISGRNYSGSNSFFLQMDTAMKGYKTPVYMTFLQIQKENARIKKGAEAMPVIYWDFTIQDKDGKKIDRGDYRNLSKEEQAQYTVIPFLRAYNVFNVDQTNLQEVNKEKYDKIGNTSEEIYKDGMEYYSSALHEMAHSTGTEERLNRVKGDKFGDPKYAKEELVAELTAANVGYAMGFDRRILDNNAAYLDGWISVLKENPKFIVSVMADVNKASSMVLEAVDKQRIALGEAPILDRNKEDVPDKAEMLNFEDGAIIKKKNGDYAIRASFQGVELDMKPIDKETGMKYFLMPEGREKQNLLSATLTSSYRNEVLNMGRQETKSLKIS